MGIFGAIILGAIGGGFVIAIHRGLPFIKGGFLYIKKLCNRAPATDESAPPKPNPVATHLIDNFNNSAVILMIHKNGLEYCLTSHPYDFMLGKLPLNKCLGKYENGYILPIKTANAHALAMDKIVKDAKVPARFIVEPINRGLIKAPIKK